MNRNKIGKTIFLFVVLLFMLSVPAFGQSAKEAIKALKKLEARCETGTNYRDYVNAMVDAKFEVNLFLEGSEAKSSPPSLVESITNAMRAYEKAKDDWKSSIDINLPSIKHLDNAIVRGSWDEASMYLKSATMVLSDKSKWPVIAVINIDNNPFKGNKNAKIAVVEFFDFQCSFCLRHSREVLTRIEKEYISTGKIKYVFVDFPLAFHKQAFKAAEAALCAGEQDKYWEMHDQLFSNQKALEPKYLSEYAKTINLDMPKFQQCLDSAKFSEAVNKNITQGQRAGITGTPCFFVGYIDKDEPDKIKATKFIKGAQPYYQFQEGINELEKKIIEEGKAEQELIEREKAEQEKQRKKQSTKKKGK